MKPIHPFPARMAPEVVEQMVNILPQNSFVFDPMCGSGTTLRHALEAGHKVIGCDIDPLAVKMSRVWCRKYNFDRLQESLSLLRKYITKTRVKNLPTLDIDCQETNKFMNFWFAPKQQVDLRMISSAISFLFPEGRTRDFFHTYYASRLSA